MSHGPHLPGSRPPLRRGASFAARPSMQLDPPGGAVGSSGVGGGGGAGQDGNVRPTIAIAAAPATAGGVRRPRLRRGATFGSRSRASDDLPTLSAPSSPALQYSSHDRPAALDDVGGGGGGGGGSDSGGDSVPCAGDACRCGILEVRVRALERHLDVLRDVLVVATCGGAKEAAKEVGGGGGVAGGWASWFGSGGGSGDGGKGGSAASRRRRALRAEVASLRRTTDYLFKRLAEGREEGAVGGGGGRGG